MTKGWGTERIFENYFSKIKDLVPDQGYKNSCNNNGFIKEKLS